MTINEAANITATVFATAIVDTYKAGGNPALFLLAMFGLFAILASAIKDSSKVLGTMFIVAIAAPILFIEHLWKRHVKKKNKLTQQT